MGMSCTAEQGKALDLIRQLHDKNGLINGKYFIEGPRPKDYMGTMCLPVYEMKGENLWQKIGYVRIKPNGKISFPRILKNQIRKEV
ncbi:MAG: hypothetical protein DRO05_00605 [Thermoproteota archaeon]|nr:MAG: hypothetical protein DRO05_00605 [Candidatus Korarchaeota archaeon]